MNIEIQLTQDNAKYSLFLHIFNSYPRFSHILGLFPLHISLCSSYLEASKAFFLLSPKNLYLAFLQTYSFSHYSFIFFWDKPVPPLAALVTSCISPPSLAASSLPVPTASAPKLALAVCSQGSLSLHLNYFCSIFASYWVIFFFLFLLLQHSCIILLT